MQNRLKPPVLPEKVKQALSCADWENRNVLVGCLRDRQQLRICRRLGFYHMPAERLEGDPAELKWIAIYQSQTLFGRRGGIRYFGRIVGWELLPRDQIKEIPRDSDTPYYRFTVQRWQKLPRKIVTKELPFTHLRTTEFLLHNSRETPELALEDASQFRLYRALKKLLSRPHIRTAGFRLENGGVMVKDGELCTVRNGVLRPSYVQENFKALPYTVFSHVLLELSGQDTTDPV